MNTTQRERTHPRARNHPAHERALVGLQLTIDALLEMYRSAAPAGHDEHDLRREADVIGTLLECYFLPSLECVAFPWHCHRGRLVAELAGRAREAIAAYDAAAEDAAIRAELRAWAREEGPANEPAGDEAPEPLVVEPAGGCP